MFSYIDNLVPRVRFSFGQHQEHEIEPIRSAQS